WDRLQELLAQFELIKNGSSAPMLNEEDYEALIEYFFSNGEEREAILACDIATTYYPFSADILLLKAEILTQAQKTGQALLVLDQLEETGNKTLDSVLLRSEILVSQGKA